MKLATHITNDAVKIKSDSILAKKLNLPKVKLDLGGGVANDAKTTRYTRYLDGSYNPDDFISLDRFLLEGVDIACDLTKGLPFEDSSLDEVICIHVLEHISDLKSFMKEIHRVLKKGGSIKIWVPHCFSPSAFGDSTHVRFFTYETLSQFDSNSSGSYYYDFHLKFVSSKMQLLRRWYKPNLIEKFLEYIINKKQRSGERFLKVLFYKEWEVYNHLIKE